MGEVQSDRKAKDKQRRDVRRIEWRRMTDEAMCMCVCVCVCKFIKVTMVML